MDDVIDSSMSEVPSSVTIARKAMPHKDDTCMDGKLEHQDEGLLKAVPHHHSCVTQQRRWAGH